MNNLDIYSVFIFCGTTLMLAALSLIGREVAKKKKNHNEDDLLKLVLSSVLSFLALLIGFSMSVAISGFDESQAAARNEALAIHKAYLYSDFLVDNKQVAKGIINEYLTLRIAFYQDGESVVNDKSQRQQTLLWRIFAEELKKNDISSINAGIDSVTHLIESQKITTSLWENNVPILAWFIIYFLSAAACIILGYNIKVHKNLLIYFIFPIILATAFFIIQQIDNPGKSLVRVNISDLLNVSLQIQSPIAIGK